MKQIAPNYTYNKTTGVITLTGVNIDRDQLLLIVNTTRNVTYYNFADSATTLQAFTQGANTSLTLNSSVITASSAHANGDALTIYYDDQASTVTATDLGAQADAVATTDTGTFSVIALIKRGLQNWTSLLAKIPTLVSGRIPVDGSGVTQPVSLASVPSHAVTGTFWQTTQPVSLASVPTHGVTGTFWQTTQPVSGTVTANGGDFTALNGDTVPARSAQIGFKDAVGTGDFVTVDNDSRQFPISGTVTANAFGKSGVNDGTLYQIPVNESGNSDVLQRNIPIGFIDSEGFSSIVATDTPLPISGTVTANAGTGTFKISDKGSTGESNVTSFTSTSSAVLKASNSNRKLLTIFNEGNGTLFILLGSGTASTTNYSLRLSAGDFYELDKYTGGVNAIFSTAGTARVTEIT